MHDTKTDNELECPFEVGKEYLTRDGRRARIYSLDGGGGFPIHGAIMEEASEGVWTTCMWKIDGGYLRFTDDDLDLMPPKKPHKWLDPAVLECGEGEFLGQRVIVAVMRPHCRSVGFSRIDLKHMLAMLDEVETPE